MAKPPGKLNDATPGELPQVTPRELHPTSDIRFVMLETQKLATLVDRLVTDVRALEAKVDPGQISRLADDLKEVKADLKEVKGKVSAVEHSMSFVKGASWVVGILFAALLAIGGLTLNAVRALQPAPTAVVSTASAANPSAMPHEGAAPRLVLDKPR